MVSLFTLNQLEKAVCYYKKGVAFEYNDDHDIFWPPPPSSNSNLDFIDLKNLVFYQVM